MRLYVSGFSVVGWCFKSLCKHGDGLLLSVEIGSLGNCSRPPCYLICFRAYIYCPYCLSYDILPHA